MNCVRPLGEGDPVKINRDKRSGGIRLVGLIPFTLFRVFLFEWLVTKLGYIRCSLMCVHQGMTS